MKTATWYALIALIIAVALLPLLKAMAPQFFPEGFRGSRVGRENFNDDVPAAAAAAHPSPPPSCDNNPCPEGHFCSDQKRCEPRYIGGTVPDGCE